MNWKKWVSIAAVCLFSSVGTTCAHEKTNVSNVKTSKTEILNKKNIRKKDKESLDNIIKILEDKKTAEIFQDPNKIKLYDLRNLNGVDLSQKYVTVDVAGAEMALGKEKEKVMEYVKKEYKKLGINLDFHFVNYINKSSLEYTKHLGLIFEDTSTFKNNPNWYGYAKRIEKTCYVSLSKTFGYYLKASLGSFSSTGADTLRKEKENIDRVNRRIVASNVTHELGHLFGLSHTHEFKDDPIDDYLTGEKNSKGRKIPNCMSYKSEVESKKYRLGCGLVEWQKKIMHSYLSNGKVKKCLELVGFYHKKYHRLVSYSSDYNFFPKKIAIKKTK